jgi:hypothetical protein
LTVTLVVDAQGLKNKSIFDKHLKKEGLALVADEDFAYEGVAHTHLFNTRAYIMDVISTGLGKSGFDNCKIMFQVGENPMEVYRYNHENGTFIAYKKL